MTIPSTEELKRLLAEFEAARRNPSSFYDEDLEYSTAQAIKRFAPDLAREVVRLQDKIKRIEQITDTHSEMNGTALSAISMICKEP